MKAITDRANNFDALRLLAAALVIWGHQYALMGQSVPLIWHNEPGAVGVVIFFAISGYLVSLSWQSDPHFWRFIMRRTLRIWPGLCAAVLLCAAVIGLWATTLPAPEYVRHPATWDYLANLWLQTRYGLPGVFEHNPLPHSVNGPLWTIPLEVACYLCLAGIGILGLAHRRWSAPIVFIALALALQWRYSPPPGQPMPTWSFGLQYGMVFALGASLAAWKNSWETHRWATTLLLCAGLIALHLWGPLPFAGQAPLLGLAVLVVVWGTASTPLLNRAGHWGDFSYGLYIYAFPVQQILVWYFANQLEFGMALFLGLFITLALAATSWHLLEKPALAFKPGKPHRRNGC